MIITQTPFRLSLVGGGSDVESWFLKHGGLVVGGTINKFCYISTRYLPPYHPYISRLMYSKIECVKNNEEIEHKAALECMKYLEMDQAGLEIVHSSDLPSRSGIGSSSSFVVGLLNALSTMKHIRMYPDELAKTSVHIEREVLKEAGGVQDQWWAAHGCLNVIAFKPNGTVSVNPMNLPKQQIQNLQSSLLLMFTGIQRTSSEVAKSYVHKLENEKNKEMWAIMRLAEKGIDAIYNQSYEQLGNLIDQSWKIKASLSSSVSSADIDKAYSTARVLGAFGGKIIGSGGGGCLLLVVPIEKREYIASQMKLKFGFQEIPFEFSWEGSKVIFASND